MKKKFFKFYVFAICLGILASCQSEEETGENPQENPYTPIEISEELKSSVADINNFSMELYKNSVSNCNLTEQNVCISPYNLFVNLSMIANGVKPEIEADMLRMLGLESKEISVLNAFNHTLLQDMPNLDKKTKLVFANSFWCGDLQNIKSEFLASLTDNYLASTFNIYPGGIEGMNAINEWVSDKTFGMIPRVLKNPIEVDAALINTTYFKGEWKSKFKPENTKSDTFYNIDGTTTKTATMHQKSHFEAMETPNETLLCMPYGNSNFCMYVIMPAKGTNLKDYVSNLSSAKLDEVLSNTLMGDVELSFPKFETAFNESLLETIEQMLGSSIKTGFYKDESREGTISLIQHATKIKVDEEGTVAVAATVSGECTAGPSFTIKIDRPFLYLIKETSTGITLFMGQQTNF